MRRLLLIAGVVVAGCAYRSPASPTPIEPTPPSTTLAVELTASTRLDHRIDLVAIVTQDGTRRSGVAIELTSDSGVLTVTQAITDANGEARSVLSASGDATVRVRAGQAEASVLTRSPVPFILINTLAVATRDQPIVVSALTGWDTFQEFTWQFGDGAQLTSRRADVVHVYHATGQYTITVSGHGEPSGLLTRGSAVIEVVEPSSIPMLLTVAPQRQGVGSIINLSGWPSDGTHVTAFRWDFGDGTHATTASGNLTHVYTSPGVKVISVSVAAGGRSGYAVTEVFITP